MATAKQQENMLLTEHFTWPPISLIDDIINMINEVLYRCTEVLDTQLSTIDPSLIGFSDRAAAENRLVKTDAEGNQLFPEAKLEIEEGVLKLETLVENAVDKNFDKLEIWTLRNVFSLERDKDDIGKWIRLGHYENLSAPPKDTNLSPQALITLRRKLQETQKLHAALLAEKTRNEAQIQRLRALLQPPPKREPRLSEQGDTNTNEAGAPFDFLTHTPAAQALGIQTLPASTNTKQEPDAKAGPSHTPLTTHTQFTYAQLPHLRQLLATLRPHLATSALPTKQAGTKDELAKERKIYIESQSKRVLERRGVDTVDGVEGAVEGTRSSAEEVKGLESIVEALNRRGERNTGAGAQEGGDEMDLS